MIICKNCGKEIQKSDNWAHCNYSSSKYCTYSGLTIAEPHEEYVLVLKEDVKYVVDSFSEHSVGLFYPELDRAKNRLAEAIK